MEEDIKEVWNNSVWLDFIEEAKLDPRMCYELFAAGWRAKDRQEEKDERE